MRSSANSLRLAGAAALFFAFAVPAAAADTPAPTPSDAATTDTGASPAAAKPATKAKEERKICRAEGATGSNLPSKKICLTAREWRDRSEAEY
jgi:hypothetical protein